MLEIVKAPNPVLSQTTSLVNPLEKSVLTLIEQMTQALEAASDPIGVGLAAPQVGRSVQIFIARPRLKSKILVFINPRIIDNSPIVQTNKGERPAGQSRRLEALAGSPLGGARKLEGCLSLQDIWGEVIRYPTVTVEYLDEKNRKHVKKFSGFMSTIIQHEIDHLNGVLFPKRVLEQKGTLYKSEKDEKGEDIFEEIKI